MPQPIRRYAEGTEVTVLGSKIHIIELLDRYHLTTSGVNVETQGTQVAAVIPFQCYGRNIVFRRPLPYPDDRRFTCDPRGGLRTKAQAQAAYEAELRRAWRVVLMQLKAKLEAVMDEREEDRPTAFRREFLADTMLPDGSLLGDWAEAQIEAAYRDRRMPPLLPGGRLSLPPGALDPP